MISSFILDATKIVFKNWKYIILAGSTAALFWIIFNYFEQLLFFFPYFVFYYPLPIDAIPGFIISNMTAVLLGMVVSMNIYVLRCSSIKFVKKSTESIYNKNRFTIFPSLFSGSSISIISSACSSCSSILITILLPTIGTAGGAVVISVLDNYHIYLRVISIVILLCSYYFLSKRIVNMQNSNLSCSIHKD